MVIFTEKAIGISTLVICALIPLSWCNASEQTVVQQYGNSAPLRTWTDSSGSYRIDGSFAGYADGRVSIRKTDGSEISVPLERLSETDGKYVRVKLRSRSSATGKPDMGPVFTAEDTRRRDAADQLVRKAIIADLNGHAAERNQMLSMAVETDPGFEPARWLSGQVCNSGERAAETWLSVERSEQLAAADPLLAEYARRRDAAKDDATSQEALALWCRKQGLDEREKIHWRFVLDKDPNHRAARRCLQLQDYNGRLLTREQIAEAKQQAIVLELKRKEWMPKLNGWRKAIQGYDQAAANEARREMEQLRDADVVGLLESYLSPRSAKLSSAVVETLSNIPERVATNSLVRHAVKSQWSEVRRAAAEQLQERPKYSFVPLLINAMASPLKFSSWMEGSDVGYTIEQEGKNVDRVLEGTVDIRATPASNDNRDVDFARSADAADRAKQTRAREVARDLEEYVDRNNQTAAKLNEPIRQVLTITTGENFGLDPSAWNDWWNDYNENEAIDKLIVTARRYDRALAEYTPVPGAPRRSTETTGQAIRALSDLPTNPLDVQSRIQEERQRTSAEIDQTIRESRVRMEEQQERARLESDRIRQETEARRAEREAQRSERDARRKARRAANPCECFPAGTLVRTQTGHRSIEQIRIGDLVLSQDPDTGELTYKPVVRTTVRPANKMLEIHVGGETLQTTKGHPVWVGERGWLIAKYLQPGDRLHQYFGSIEVEAVREIPVKVNVYNLVVEDFHSYFVGENSVLVHDNSVITPPSVAFLGEKLVTKR